MRPRRWPALLCALLLAGCLEREEAVTVTPDGALEVVHTIRGDAGDLDGGAARYPTAGPWEARREVRPRDDGKEEHVLVARARFASAAEVPTHFGAPGEPEGAPLQMTTRLAVVAEPGATRYVFARTYGARAWGDYRVLHARAFDQQVRALLAPERGGFDALSGAEQDRVFQAVIEWERGKARRWTEQALRAAAPDRAEAPLARLAAQDAVGAFFARELPVERARALFDLARADPARLEGELRGLQARHDHEVSEALRRALALGPEQATRLREALEAERRTFEVTEDLGDERFVVRLRLPGRVERHDADAVEDGALVWRFTGEELRDREVTLLATSVLESVGRR